MASNEVRETTGSTNAKPTVARFAPPTSVSFEVVGGPFVRRLDEGGSRLKLPASIAQALGPRVVVLPHEMSDEGRWLSIIPLPRWREILAPVVQEGAHAGDDRRARLRQLARNTALVDIAPDGRLTLPKELAARCGIEREVTCWPRFDRLEIEAGNRIHGGAEPSQNERALFREFVASVPGLR